MKVIDARSRLLRDEGGFTLPEMLVTMMIMVVVLFALYNIFDMSIRVFKFGNDKVEAVENARLGLGKMEREIRAAYPYDLTLSTPKTHLFFNTSNPPDAAVPSATQMTFGNELTGNRKIECPASPTETNPCEYITYKLSQSGDARTLLRNATSNGSSSSSGGEPVAENINGANGLTFMYLGSNGNPCANTNPTCSGADEAQVRAVRITLDVKVEGGTQTLTTDVTLRNRGG